jgi:hypothetical protein
MADQSVPGNYLCIVDTSVNSSSAFNFACKQIASLNHSLELQEKRNKLYLVHFSNLHSGIFTSNEKKEEKSKGRESHTKSILSYFGKRLIAYDIPFHLIGLFCESKSAYSDKIAFLVDRFEIGGIFVGTHKITIPSNLRANVFRINRRMGFLPDKLYLKEIIRTTDASNLKSLDETTGLVNVEAKLETDFLEYRFVNEPQFGPLERETVIAEINGEQRPKIKYDFSREFGRESGKDSGKESFGKESFGKDQLPDFTQPPVIEERLRRGSEV